MKPEKVDFYLNKRKEREREKKTGEEGSRLDGVSPHNSEPDQFPNRSPASEENTRARNTSVSPAPPANKENPEVEENTLKREPTAPNSPEYLQRASSEVWAPPYPPDWISPWRPRPVSLSQLPPPAPLYHSRANQTSVIRSHTASRDEIKTENIYKQEELR